MKNIGNKFKKKVIVLLAGIMLLSGCSTGASEEQQEAAVISEASAAVEAVGVTTEKLVPERKAEVSGIVKSIIGNEVTIALLLKDSANQAQALNEAGVELTEEEKAEKQAEKRAENATKSESGAMATKEVELSGETVDLIIPVGTPILQSTGTGVFNSVEIADIFPGMSVKIWMQTAEEGGTDLVEFVQILTQ